MAADPALLRRRADDKIIEGKAHWGGIGPLIELLTRYRSRFETATRQLSAATLAPLFAGLSRGRTLGAAHTHHGNPMSTAAQKDSEVGTLNLANDGTATCRQIDLLLADRTTRHLALPARADIAIRPNKRQNLETILEHLLAHPQRDRLRLATPSEA